MIGKVRDPSLSGTHRGPRAKYSGSSAYRSRLTFSIATESPQSKSSFRPDHGSRNPLLIASEGGGLDGLGMGT